MARATATPRSTASNTDALQDAPPGQSLLERLREAMALKYPDRAPRLHARIDEITTARATATEQIEWLEGQSNAALLESAAAYGANQEAIAQHRRQVEHLTALDKLAREELAKAEVESFDQEVRAEGLHARQVCEAAAATIAEYEKLARKIADILPQHREAFQVFSNFNDTLRSVRSSGQRDDAWLSKVRAETIGSIDPTAPMATVGDGQPLHEMVQLPAATRINPIWGDVYGRHTESDAERIERERDLEARRLADPPRPPGVYGKNADGEEVLIGRALNATFDPDAPRMAGARFHSEVIPSTAHLY